MRTASCPFLTCSSSSSHPRFHFSRPVVRTPIHRTGEQLRQPDFRASRHYQPTARWPVGLVRSDSGYQAPVKGVLVSLLMFDSDYLNVLPGQGEWHAPTDYVRLSRLRFQPHFWAGLLSCTGVRYSIHGGLARLLRSGTTFKSSLFTISSAPTSKHSWFTVSQSCSPERSAHIETWSCWRCQFRTDNLSAVTVRIVDGTRVIVGFRKHSLTDANDFFHFSSKKSDPNVPLFVPFFRRTTSRQPFFQKSDPFCTLIVKIICFS